MPKPYEIEHQLQYYVPLSTTSHYYVTSYVINKKTISKWNIIKNETKIDEKFNGKNGNEVYTNVLRCDCRFEKKVSFISLWN